MMKKSLLALAVTALSANAFAVNLDNGTAVQTFASEIDVSSSGTLVGTATKLTASVSAGFGLTNGYIRYDLSNGATFNTVLTGTTELTVPATVTTVKVASGGQKGDNFVIYALTGTVASTDILTLTTDAKVVNKNAVPVTYAIYETAAGAANKVGPLSTKSGSLLTFAPALKSVVTSGAYNGYIDAIGNKGLTFVQGGTKSASAILFNLNPFAVDTTVLKADGSNIAAATDLFSKHTLTLKGNFSAIAAKSGLTDGTPTDFVVADDKQSASLEGAGGFVTYTVTGTDAIAETSINADLTFTPVTGYKVDSISLGKVAELQKNGTTKALNLALKPNGAFSNFVRINNTDSIPGLFFIKVINDAGESASFPLSAVAGQSDTIAAGASTSQMPIADIFAAAEANGLALSGEGKLRLEVTGQTNSLDAQVYTVSTDGTTFSKF